MIVAAEIQTRLIIPKVSDNYASELLTIVLLPGAITLITICSGTDQYAPDYDTNWSPPPLRWWGIPRALYSGHFQTLPKKQTCDICDVTDIY